MEIGALLREVLRRAWVVALLVVLAAGGAWVATSGSKNLYRAEVVLTVPDSQSGTVGATGQYVADFVQAIDTPIVTTTVAKKLGVDAGDVKTGGSADQQAQSKYITVTYQSDDKATVGPVAKELALAAASKVAESAVVTAKARVSAAKQAIKEAQAEETKADDAVTAALARAGGVNPVQEYQQALSDLNRLEASLDRARLQGDSTSTITSQIATLRASLPTLQTASREFTKLTYAQSTNDDNMKVLRGRLLDFEDQLTDASLQPMVDEPVIAVTSGRVARVRAVMISSGIVAIVGFALLVLLAGLTAGRGRRVQSYADAPLTGTGAAAPADSLLGGFIGAPGAAVTRPAPAAPASPYQPPAPAAGRVNGHDDLLAFPPSNPTQAVRRRDTR
ncbi:MAG: Wzz/FepE/Etk N-terminal domain-containing protein [Kineosporiaceae bacterium]